MPSFGGGTGQAITTIPCAPPTSWTVSHLPDCRAVTAARYARILGYYECSYFGVRRAGAPESCRSIWVLRERDMVERYLAEAQEEIEQQTVYPLCVRWFEEDHYFTVPLRTNWGKVIAGGVRALQAIAENTAVDHSTDPAVIGPLGTTVTDTSEVKVYYPSTESDEPYEIEPSRMTLAGGLLTIWIPRCRMVHPDYMDNARTGVDYTVLTNFLASVDVMRVYNDTSTNGTLIWPHACDNCTDCTCPTCSEYTQDACLYVKNGETGAVDLLPGTYANGVWTATTSGSGCCCGPAERARVYYMAGMQDVTRQAEDAVIRLAHAKMPEEPCACELVKLLWARDRNVPEVLTRERINCRFGLSDGAWMAWQFAQALRLVRGGRPL